MLGPENIAIAIFDSFNRNKAKRFCKGGLWYGRVEENAEAPYARFGITLQDQERLSNKSIWVYGIRIEVWGDNGAVDLTRVRVAIENAINDVRNIEGVSKVIDVRKDDIDLELDESKRQADDICLLTLGWSLKLEGKKNGR